MKRSMVLIWGLILVLIVLIGFYIMNGSLLGTSKSDYQAVFLTNGQVYFGKLTHETGSEAILKDIYYLQVQQQVQPADKKSTEQPQVQLVKLGDELHGPMDQMRINRTQILFVEDLKNDGKVVSAIHTYQQNGSKPTAPPASSQK